LELLQMEVLLGRLQLCTVSWCGCPDPLRNCTAQFMENFCYERKTLFSFAKHHETAEPLPEELYQKLCAARTFRAGSMMMRQVRLG
jgi:Zn-dependent oligopeptidase